MAIPCPCSSTSNKLKKPQAAAKQTTPPVARKFKRAGTSR